MKSPQSARPGRRQKQSVVHVRRPANRLNATDSFQLPSVATLRAVWLGAADAVWTLPLGKESKWERKLLQDITVLIHYWGMRHPTVARTYRGARAVREKGLRAFAGDLTCGKLPQHHGPWTAP